MPLYRKLPHRGFNNYNFRSEYATVNVGELSKLDASITEVTSEILSQNGLIRADGKKLKVLGDGEVTRAFKVTAAKFSESAKAKLSQAGGEAIVA